MQGTNFYTFQSKLHVGKKQPGQTYNERDLFKFMLARCKEQTKVNKYFTELPLTKVKDVVYSSGERATFKYDADT
jgi:hypothetical protein